MNDYPPTIDFEQLLHEMIQRLLDAKIPGIDSENIVLPQEEKPSGKMFYVAVGYASGTMTMTSERTSRRPVTVHFVITTKNPGASGRIQCSTVAAGIIRTFPAMDPKRSNFDDIYGNRYMIESADVLPAESNQNEYRVDARIILRMDINH